MSVNRRDFLRQLLMATAAVQTLDIEQLLWVPKSMITVPDVGSVFMKIAVDSSKFDAALVEIGYKFSDLARGGQFIAERVFPIVRNGPKTPPGRFTEGRTRATQGR